MSSLSTKRFRVLIVTPTLGDSPWLDATVASVARLSLDGFHVLVAPATMVAGLARRHPLARVLPDQGGGMYAAINAGLAAVPDWDAFTYLNDDDVLLPNFAAAVRAMASREASPLIVYGRVRLIDSQGRRLGMIPTSPAPSLNRALYAQRLEPVFQHGTLVNRAAWTRLGGFDESLRFCGDTEFFARASILGIPFFRIGGSPLAAFRLRAGQLTKNRPAMTAERAQVDEKLGLLAPRLTLRHHWARAVYRFANAGVYAERIARHGFLSFDQLLERGGSA